MELKEAIEYLMLMKDKLDFNKYGFVYGVDCIDTVLQALENSIPKKVIEEKIKKLDKEEQELQNSISNEEREEYSDASISWDLCNIETRRRCYKELLEGK